jgi:hypothetical protein
VSPVSKGSAAQPGTKQDPRWPPTPVPCPALGASCGGSTARPGWLALAEGARDGGRGETGRGRSPCDEGRPRKETDGRRVSWPSAAGMALRRLLALLALLPPAVAMIPARHRLRALAAWLEVLAWVHPSAAGGAIGGTLLARQAAAAEWAAYSPALRYGLLRAAAALGARLRLVLEHDHAHLSWQSARAQQTRAGGAVDSPGTEHARARTETLFHLAEFCAYSELLRREAPRASDALAAAAGCAPEVPAGVAGVLAALAPLSEISVAEQDALAERLSPLPDSSENGSGSLPAPHLDRAATSLQLRSLGEAMLEPDGVSLYSRFQQRVERPATDVSSEATDPLRLALAPLVALYEEVASWHSSTLRHALLGARLWELQQRLAALEKALSSSRQNIEPTMLQRLGSSVWGSALRKCTTAVLLLMQLRARAEAWAGTASKSTLQPDVPRPQPRPEPTHHQQPAEPPSAGASGTTTLQTDAPRAETQPDIPPETQPETAASAGATGGTTLHTVVSPPETESSPAGASGTTAVGDEGDDDEFPAI